MSKGLRTAAFPRDSARARPIEAELPLEIRPALGRVSRRAHARRPAHHRRGADAGTACSSMPRAHWANNWASPGCLRVPPRGHVEAHQVSVVAATVDQLMAAWLGELLHCARHGRRWFGDISVSRISLSHLRAEMVADQEIRWRIDPTSIAIVDTRVAMVNDPLGKPIRRAIPTRVDRCSARRLERLRGPDHQHQIGQEVVEHQDRHRALDHGVGGRAAELARAAAHVEALVAGDQRERDAERRRLDLALRGSRADRCSTGRCAARRLDRRGAGARRPGTRPPGRRR